MKKWTKKWKIAMCSIWTSLVLAGLLGSLLPQLPTDADPGYSVLSCDGKGKESPLEDMDELY